MKFKKKRIENFLLWLTRCLRLNVSIMLRANELAKG